MVYLSNPHVYTPIHGIITLLQYQNNYPHVSSGAGPLAFQARNLLGNKIPDVFVHYSTAIHFNLCGSYAQHYDTLLSLFCTFCFSVSTIHEGITFGQGLGL